MRWSRSAVRAQVEQLQADDLAKLDTRRRGKLLALEVGARITSADQKCFEIPATEDEGLDMELEFTNDDGEGTGRRLYLQLKSGNSHLTKRKTDGAEILTIKKHRWLILASRCKGVCRRGEFCQLQEMLKKPEL
jgi:hypothetical protein